MSFKKILWCSLVPIIIYVELIFNQGWKHTVYLYGETVAFIMFLSPLPLFIVNIIIAIKVAKRKELKEKEEKERMLKIQAELTAKKEQEKKEKKEESAKAYNEISEIWEYGDKTMRAVSSSSSLFMYIKLSYSASKTNPWTISIKSPNNNTFSNFKAKRNGDSLVGTSDDKVLVITKGQIVYGDMTFFFNPENERVKKVDELMKRLLNGRKIEAYREEHFRTSANNLDALPKFHFTFTDNGIKCDEINYPKKQLDDFFEKHNGGEFIYQNKIFYIDFCKNGSLKQYSIHEKYMFEKYMQKMSIQAIEQGCPNCNTDFDIANWQVEVDKGLNGLFKSFKSYVNRKTLDVVPVGASETAIYFKHKFYSVNTNNLVRDTAISSMQNDRIKNDDNIYFVSIVDNMILIKINEDAFVSVLDEDKTA